MIAPATRANLLSAQIDKPAILASYEQGLFTVGNLAILLENYCAMQEIAREGRDERADAEPYDFESLLILIDSELEGVQPEHADRRGKLLHAARVNIRNYLAANPPSSQDTAETREAKLGKFLMSPEGEAWFTKMAAKEGDLEIGAGHSAAALGARTVYVVMGNDYPDSVWSSEVKADKAVRRAQDGDRRVRRGRPPIHYRSYGFTLDKDPWP